MTQVQAHEWRRYGFGGPPEPWERGAQRDLDRLATSYYLDLMESRGLVLARDDAEELRAQVERMFTDATRHKHEIDYTLRHWATPVERARVADRLGQLMRLSRQMRELAPEQRGPAPEPLPAA
ncbi:MAG TPA: hypothetical protein VFM19_07555 [Candidatus Limnocylindria bacterium]|nr:hypothetical protein [Candidatus Limnocylindria bacterium]